MNARMRRLLGIAAGVTVHAMFAVTVVRLFLFLQDTRNLTGEGALGWDILLALQFVIPHSALLHPVVRSRLTKYVSSVFYGLFYTVATCVGLWITFWFWRQHPTELWHFTGVPAAVMTGGFYLSWVALFYSLHLTGLGWQTGLTPWLAWVLGRPQPPREFQPRSLYRLVRHPVYISFAGLVWFTPVMSLDRAVLTGIWSVYLLYGSYLKDERLAFYLGRAYRSYQAQVIGFPGMFFGPLGKRKALPPT